MIQFVVGLLTGVIAMLLVLSNETQDIAYTQKRIDYVTSVCKSQNSQPDQMNIIKGKANCKNGFKFSFEGQL
tara:strand:- start:16005 stop:16220 length:216 start_codon:yes stop_codon:yes gene_type:complete